jgi:hypothetical protein
MWILGMDLCPQGATDIDGYLPRNVCPLFGKLGYNVRRCQFPLDIPRVAFLQPHDLSFRRVDIVCPHRWSRLPIRIRQGSPRTLYVTPIPIVLHD